MLLALLVVLAVIVGAASVGLAWTHTRRVRAATSSDLEGLATTLLREPPPTRVTTMLARTTPGAWEHELAVEVHGASHDDAKLCALNEHLSALDHALRLTARWPSTGIRIAGAGALLLAVVSLVTGQPLSGSIGIVVVGAVAALACREAEARAERMAAAKRRGVDRLVSVCLGHLAGRPSTPFRRSRRRRA